MFLNKNTHKRITCYSCSLSILKLFVDKDVITDIFYHIFCFTMHTPSVHTYCYNEKINHFPVQFCSQIA